MRILFDQGRPLPLREGVIIGVSQQNLDRIAFGILNCRHGERNPNRITERFYHVGANVSATRALLPRKKKPRLKSIFKLSRFVD